MILMPQIFDVTANENARYKRNELEYCFTKALDEWIPSWILIIIYDNNGNISDETWHGIRG